MKCPRSGRLARWSQRWRWCGVLGQRCVAPCPFCGTSLRISASMRVVNLALLWWLSVRVALLMFGWCFLSCSSLRGGRARGGRRRRLAEERRRASTRRVRHDVERRRMGRLPALRCRWSLVVTREGRHGTYLLCHNQVVLERPVAVAQDPRGPIRRGTGRWSIPATASRTTSSRRPGRRSGSPRVRARSATCASKR